MKKLRKMLALCMSVCLISITLLSGAVLPASAEELTEGDYTYEIVDGGAVITDIYWGVSGEVVIPDNLGGYNVTGIGELAFAYVSGITSVTIPEGITSIGRQAFFSCDILSEVYISSTVTSISEGAFAGCMALSSLNVNSDNQYFSSTDGVLYNGDTSKLIICPGAISGAITIPASVISIADDVFSSCFALENINVAEDNQNYKSVDGVLYDKEATKIIKCPTQKNGSVTIPSTVTTVTQGAFQYCSKITELVISDGVKGIGNWAFSYCTGLKTVTIPQSVTIIGALAFSGCEGLTEVILSEGLITIGAEAFKGCNKLKSITVPKSVTQIEAECIGLDDKYENIAGFTIYGYEGSAAESYAKQNGFEFVDIGKPQITKGDVNGDGTINSTDFMQVRRHFLNLYAIPADKQAAADVNQDGNINSTDFMQIRRHFLGLYTIG